MHKTLDTSSAIAGLTVGVTVSARESGAAKLKALHREVVDGLPTARNQEIRVLHATLEPGDSTPYHSLDGREPAAIRAGEVFVEPPHIRMTGRNLEAEQAAKMVLFYVSDPDTPFADPVASTS